MSDTSAQAVEVDRERVDLDVLHRLLRAQGQMPYGGIVHAPRLPNGWNRGETPFAGDVLDLLAKYLEELATTLAAVANGNQADRAELERYRSMHRSAGALLAELLAAGTPAAE